MDFAKATKKDYEGIASIWNQNKKELTNDGRQVTAKELEGFLDHGFQFYVLKDQAFVCVKKEFGAVFNFAHFGVDGKHRGKGIGKTVCHFVEELAKREGCKKIKSTTRADNPIPQVLLLKMGYRVVRINYHQFSDGVDEMEYEKWLG